jgi:hypothetical protein
MEVPWGGRVFGAASLGLGVASLALHDQLISNWQWPGDAAFLVLSSIAMIVGGIAMQFHGTAKPGAIALGSVYLLFALTFVPEVVTRPATYANWGEVFYRLASVSGATVAYCLATSSMSGGKTICRAAVTLLGVCNASFAVEQVEFLGRTATLVPSWMPPSGMFWAVATTVAFGLAAVSLVSGYKSLLASRLVTLMLVSFGIVIWIPTLIADSKTHSNWSESLETFAIAGAAWIVADLLARQRLPRKGSSGDISPSPV